VVPKRKKDDQQWWDRARTVSVLIDALVRLLEPLVRR